MSRKILVPLALLLTAVLASLPGQAKQPLPLRSVNVEVPDSDRKFPGAGSDAINNNCLACHSADMFLNQPALPNTAWQAEVNKMIHVYKAPLAESDVGAIVDYLTRTESKK